jgi:hypothetical protein
MKNFLIALAVLLICCLSITDLQAQHKKTKWLDGSWVGVGYQPVALSQTTWEIFLDYDYDNNIITINYPSFPCSGHWKLVKADKNKAEFIEYIDEGKEYCNDLGVIIVTRIDERYITISYFLPEVMDGEIAFSTMEKAREN